MSMATAFTGVPVARAFTSSALQKPRSVQQARRAPLIVRAKDPAAPDKAAVKDEVIDCKCAAFVRNTCAGHLRVHACISRHR